MAKIPYVKSGEPAKYGQSAAATAHNLRVAEALVAGDDGPKANLGQSGAATSINIKKADEAVAKLKDTESGRE